MLVIPFILGLQPQSVVSRRPLKQKQKPSTSSELVSKLKSKWFPIVAQHEIEPKFKCSKCTFETTRKHCLDQHIRGHLDCDQCGKVFIGKNGSCDLKNHLKTHQIKVPPITVRSI